MSSNGIGVGAAGAAVAVVADQGDCQALLANTHASGTLWWGFDTRTSAVAQFGIPLVAGAQVGIPMLAGDKVYVAGAGVNFAWAKVRA